MHRAVDFISEFKGGLSLEVKKITLLGYSIGGMVALHAAALDDRIASVATFAGFTPMRTDNDAKGTGGNRRWWEWHALIPKLGLFHDREKEIPYDYDDLLTAISPRRVLVVAPEHDWHATVEDVRRCVDRAQHPALTFVAPDDTNRFQSKQHAQFLDWLAQP